MILTKNSKTVLSLDFDREKTCASICSYCYVANMERMYKTYKSRNILNSEAAQADPVLFAKNVKKEYWKLRNSKTTLAEYIKKLPLRLYGSGDYVPAHLQMMKEFDFKFYLISKNLTRSEYQNDLLEIQNLPNCTAIVLSFDKDNFDQSRYEFLKNLADNNKKLKFSFTGLPEEVPSGLNSIIYFNTSKKKAIKLMAKKVKGVCGCTSGVLPNALACTICNRCWKSLSTKSTNGIL